MYSTFLSGVGQDEATGIAVDGTGTMVVTGTTRSPDFPTTAGAAQIVPGLLSDTFVTRFNPGGAGLSDSTFLGSAVFDFGQGIALDPAGDVYVTGPQTRCAVMRSLIGAFDHGR